MDGANPPKARREGVLERGEEMPRRSPAVTGLERPPLGEIQVEPRTAFVRPEPERLGAFFSVKGVF